MGVAQAQKARNENRITAQVKSMHVSTVQPWAVNHMRHTASYRNRTYRYLDWKSRAALGGGSHRCSHKNTGTSKRHGRACCAHMYAPVLHRPSAAAAVRRPASAGCGVYDRTRCDLRWDTRARVSPATGLIGGHGPSARRLACPQPQPCRAARSSSPGCDPGERPLMPRCIAMRIRSGPW